MSPEPRLARLVHELRSLAPRRLPGSTAVLPSRLRSIYKNRVDEDHTNCPPVADFLNGQTSQNALRAASKSRHSTRRAFFCVSLIEVKSHLFVPRKLACTRRLLASREGRSWISC
uniref:Uncharacterized protein n=1 Tax=Mycena chlorophos TaxID=658473 RepID=A0ABQ0M218_MYCCL|nr:predicted protein [Mycena chlorophos]